MTKILVVNITEEQREKCNKIIHEYVCRCAVYAAKDQISAIEKYTITLAHEEMVTVLGSVFNQKISRTMAEAVLSEVYSSCETVATPVKCRLIPGAAISVNSGILARLTEYIGWMVVDRFLKEFYGTGVTKALGLTWADIPLLTQ